MNRNTKILTAAMLALTAVLCLCGCAKEQETAQPEIAIEEQGTPDIAIEESPALSSQSTPPNLIVETVSGEVATATYATLGGYTWRYTADDGSEKLSEDEAPCAAEMKEIATISRSSTDGRAKLQISGGTLVYVQIWPDGETMENGEKLLIENNEIVFPESGDYRYEIAVEYPSGRVYYAFMITG